MEHDSAGLEELLENRRQFLSFLEKRVGDPAVAEDILQEAFARSIDRVEELQAKDSAVAWFYRVLRNAVIDHYRRSKSATRSLEQFARELERSDLPGEEVRGELCRCVTRLAGSLKPEYKEALERVELAGVPVKDFAAQAGISASNAGVRIFRAREALRREVIRTCGACAEHGCVDCSCHAPSSKAHGCDR